LGAGADGACSVNAGSTRGMEMEWILVIFLHAGILSDKDSMAVTSIAGFSTQVECQAAGKDAEKLTSSTTKATRFVCLQRKKV